jgi:hypothetical protein
MQSFATLCYRALGKLTAPLGVGLALISCGSGSDSPRSARDERAGLISLNPGTSVDASLASQCGATCPGNKQPDQCGTWAGVELRASRLGDKTACDQASDQASHCLCAAIDFQIPDRLPVTSGSSGWDWDKPTLSFREPSGRFVECHYRGTGSPPGRKPLAGAPDYLLDGCDSGYKAGDTAHGDWFELDLGKCQANAASVEVKLRLGAPDVVNGVVQEQVFFASDPRIAGAALHVPRGSAPPFETFTLQTLTQVTPGLTIPNGAMPATSIGYGVDVHSDQTDHIVFTTVPGAACPRVELPYEPATLSALVGPGGESAIRADQITTLTGLTSGDSVLVPAGPVTVNLAQHTLSFCVEHLSFYAGVVNSLDSLLDSATISGASLSNYPLVTGGVPAGSLPLLEAGTTYTLQVKFKNTVATNWGAAVGLVPVSVAYGTPLAPPTVTVITSPWNPTTPTYSWSAGAPVGLNGFGTATVKVRAPTPSAPLNFCLARMVPTPIAPFGACFSWDSSTRGGTTGVAEAEICDGLDNDLDGKVDNVAGATTAITRSVFTGTNSATENVGVCKDGVQTCMAGAWVDTTAEVVGGSETCNHLDDDCDGLVDNSTAAEVCDGIDNNCDGRTDEGCPIAFDYLSSPEAIEHAWMGPIGANDTNQLSVCEPLDHGKTFMDGIATMGSSEGIYALGNFCAWTRFDENTTVSPYAYSFRWQATYYISEPTGGDRGGQGVAYNSQCTQGDQHGLMTGLRVWADSDHILALQAQCSTIQVDGGVEVAHEVGDRYWTHKTETGPGGGDLTEDTCPAGQYIQGLTHRASEFGPGNLGDGVVRLHTVWFTCAPIGVWRQ